MYPHTGSIARRFLQTLSLNVQSLNGRMAIFSAHQIEPLAIKDHDRISTPPTPQPLAWPGGVPVALTGYARELVLAAAVV